MSKKYKKMQGDHQTAALSTAAPSAAPSSRRSSNGDNHDGGRLEALAATASDDQADKPATHAIDNSGEEGASSSSLSQHLLINLHIDNPLFRQRGGEGGSNDRAAGKHQANSRSQPSSLLHPGDGRVGGGGGGSDSGDPTLQQPSPRGAGHGGARQEGSDESAASPIFALTRAFSTPESRDKYRPLEDRAWPSGRDDDDGHLMMDLRQAATTEDDLLKRDYPLLLQRSASSAFGSPALGKFKCTRSGSNSGNSDPGASAFHPVWSGKSLSTSSAGSDQSRSEVGASTRSAPAGDHRRKLRKNSSPWRKVMERMKKGTSGGKGSSKNTFRRQLSGRENPARPNLSEDEATSPVNELASRELLVVTTVPTMATIVPTMAATGVDICRDLLKMSSVGDGKAAAAKHAAAKCSSDSNGSTSSGQKKASNKQSKKDKTNRTKPTSSKIIKESKKIETKRESAKTPKTKKDVLSKSSVKSYNDPGVALDISESNDDDDDDTIEPITGKFIAWNDDTHTQSRSRPPSVDVTPQLKKNGQSEHKHQHPQSPSSEVPCDSVEVIHRPSSCADGRMTHVMEETAFGSHSVEVFSSPATSIEQNSPPALERMTVEESPEDRDNFPYHPLGGGGDGDLQDVAATNAQETVSQLPARLKFRSPQRNAQLTASTTSSSSGKNAVRHQRSPSCTSSNNSPDSRLSSSGGSPASRISSSNSRATDATGDRTINTLQTEGSLVVDGADFEVREANRRSGSIRGSRLVSGSGETNHEVVAGPDGNDTVFSSSTTSSNYQAYLSSPRPLRDGATMPVDRFFAGGNVAMSPSPRQRETVDHSHLTMTSSAVTVAPGISKFIALSPKKSQSARISGSAVSGINARDTTHSPHTVSSNSVSANSSSSSETKKPLKFVAYEIQEEGEAGSPYDEPSPNSMIKPRISNVGRYDTISQQEPQRRPPMIQRTSAAGYDPRKPPQSPRKPDYGRLSSGARTPTRTPPPSFAYKDAIGSGANTPCSPPVIVDGPNVLCGDLSTKPARPYVVRRGGGGRGMFLMPPSSAMSHRPPHPPPIPPQPAAANMASAAAAPAAVSSPLRGNILNAVGGVTNGTQEILFDAVAPTDVEGGGVGPVAATVSPERHAISRRVYNNVASSSNNPNFKDNHASKEDVIAVVSPEKGF